MIATPICDFVRDYAGRQPARLHMPGHKGVGPLGCEALDITEFDGADELYAPRGVIAESQRIASRLFGARTFYSAEGSSLAIRAMLHLALRGIERPRVLAGRNAHRAFLSASALIGFDVAWLHPRPSDAYCACTIEPTDVARELDGARFDAVYLTSPDYLGHGCDLAGIAAICRARGVPLLVDDAHGAYLKFLSPSRHPIDLGADMCCDSAHKTLPALTGAAYLHIRPDDPRGWADGAPSTLGLFGSSSPSWLILQSLDACNRALEEYPERLGALLGKLDTLRARLSSHGYVLVGDEPMKLTIDAAAHGLTGDALAGRLVARGVYAEFHDRQFLTLMPTPQNSDGDLKRLEAALLEVPKGAPIDARPPAYHAPIQAMSVREAAFSARETLPLERCEGRILAESALSCPPCVPVALCGERIDRPLIERLRFFGFTRCEVVK